MKSEMQLLGPDCTPRVKAAMGRILDCFGGADGGSFVNLCAFVRELDASFRAEDERAESSAQLLNVLLKMARLINAANGEPLL